MELIYYGLCPSCSSFIESSRLELGVPCRSCLPSYPSFLVSEKDVLKKAQYIYSLLKRSGSGVLGFYENIVNMVSEISLFDEFFLKATGRRLWNIQRSWAKRILSGDSFAIIAPTGSGKSTLLQVYSLYIAHTLHRDRVASRGGRGRHAIYYILPTRELARQTYRKLNDMAAGVDGLRDLMILFYDSSSRDSKAKLDMIDRGEFDILITTSSFISRRFDLLSGKMFASIIADDLDAILRNSRNLERLLNLINVAQEDIERAFKIAVKKQELMIAKAVGNTEKFERLREEIEILRAELSSSLSGKTIGQMVVATATGRSGGIKSKILREILNFEAGGILEYVRNIIDSHMPLRDHSSICSVVEKLNPGTLIFVSKGYDNTYIERLVDSLSQRGLNAAVADSSKKTLSRFLRGEYDVLVGKASYYGTIVRGIDAPERIYNAVFIGVPKFIIPLKNYLSDLRNLGLVAISLSKHMDEFRNIHSRIINIIGRIGRSGLYVLKNALSGKIEPKGYIAEVYNDTLSWIDEVTSYIRRNKVRKLYTENSLIVLTDKGYRVYIPDPMTYIQASGRTSRFFGSGMTLGLSVVLYEYPELLDLLYRRVSRYIPDLEFIDFSDLDLDKIKRKQKASRSRRGNLTAKSSLSIETALLVVESPTKAKTFASMFGSKTKRFIGQFPIYEFSITYKDRIILISSVPTLGHVFDLMKTEGVYGVKVDENGYAPHYTFIGKCYSCGNQFTVEDPSSIYCSRCGSGKVRVSIDTMDVLRKLALEVDKIYIATDPDIEGEKIAYDIYSALKPYNSNIYRVELHEITRSELLKALDSVRGIDINLVRSQIVRRIDDRWVGFSVSRKLQESYNMRWLGAGRVQTPVLGWVIDSYNKYRSRIGYWIYVELDNGVRARIFVDSRSDVDTVSRIIEEEGLELDDLSKEIKKMKPAPPYTTDSLIHDAGRRLRYSASLIMRIAQDLFELGLITYHRTDSTRVSAKGLDIARKYLLEKYGESYISLRSWGSDGGGAHECIRPTQPLDVEGLRKAFFEGSIAASSLSRHHERLYDLIFRRFIASQMSESRVEYLRLRFRVPGTGHVVLIEGIGRVLEDGFTRIYSMHRSLPEKLADLKKGEHVSARVIGYRRGSLYRILTSSEIVRMMKERGIGRPSTYSKAVENNKRHGYIIETKRGYLVPTRIGLDVYSYVSRFYPSISTEKATRELEALIDRVQRGEISADDALDLIFKDLFTNIDSFKYKVISENVPYAARLKI